MQDSIGTVKAASFSFLLLLAVAVLLFLPTSLSQPTSTITKGETPINQTKE